MGIQIGVLTDGLDCVFRLILPAERFSDCPALRREASIAKLFCKSSYFASLDKELSSPWTCGAALERFLCLGSS